MYALEQWMEAELATHHGDQVLLSNGALEDLDTLERVGERLLDEEMTACLGETLRDGEMEPRGVTDERDVRTLRERVVEIGELSNGEVIGHRLLVARDPALGDHVRQPARAVGQQLDVSTEQRPEVARVALADRAQTDDECAERRFPTRSGHSGNAGTIMFDRNSSRSRNGQRSSSGLDTIDPSGRRIEERLGARGSSAGVMTSHTIGPGRSSTCSTCLASSCWFSMRE